MVAIVSRSCGGARAMSARRVAVSRSRTEPSRRAQRRAGRPAFAASECHGLGAINLLAVEESARVEAPGLLSRRAETKAGRRRRLHPAPEPTLDYCLNCTPRT